MWQNGLAPTPPPLCEVGMMQPSCFLPADTVALCEEVLMDTNMANMFPSATNVITEDEEQQQQRQQQHKEEEEEEDKTNSHPILYVCPAVAEAARKSSREFVHSLLRKSNAAQVPFVLPQQNAPLTITWHTNNTPSLSSSLSLSSFKPLPHTKRTRDTAELMGRRTDNEMETQSIGVCRGAGTGPMCAAHKRWRVEKEDSLAAHEMTTPAMKSQQIYRFPGRKRPREDEGVVVDAPDLFRERSVGPTNTRQ
ncbi:hypothetical protein MOQ_005586 [Trypanosoma cruzi marinkellei]|uniref:Uncharacterized protein n=1 Tax=Trypanosoma cruzi marinkellei TaxID=85056 RepID=K2M6R0_TRYCR|nr:hypothetical protein MOQ_005586 [Trypanosoma cruzi marinkellei]